MVKEPYPDETNEKSCIANLVCPEQRRRVCRALHEDEELEDAHPRVARFLPLMIDHGRTDGGEDSGHVIGDRGGFKYKPTSRLVRAPVCTY